MISFMFYLINLQYPLTFILFRWLQSFRENKI